MSQWPTQSEQIGEIIDEKVTNILDKALSKTHFVLSLQIALLSVILALQSCDNTTTIIEEIHLVAKSTESQHKTP